MKKYSVTACLLILTLLSQLNTGLLWAQESRNGYWLPVKDTLRIFLIYAELANDPDDPGRYNGWEPGELPPNPEYFFDHQLLPGQEPRGTITKYFHQASFGNYIVLADYYPELVSIDFNKVRQKGYDHVLDIIRQSTGEDIITANGYSVNRGDFDLLSTTRRYGDPKNHEPDSLLDMLMLIWRVNSKFTLGFNAGYCVPAIRRQAFKNMKGMNSYSNMMNKGAADYIIIRHEFSHLLLGGNNFHTGGSGAGSKTFMSSAGGYAMLSSWDRFSQVYSGFDRRRLGWKKPGHRDQISARNPATGQEVQSDLVYGQDFTHGSNEFVLRDFVSTGDVVRIELPYLQKNSAQVRRQWLWLENHQQLEGNLDHAGAYKKGISAYIQVNKEILSGQGVFGGNGNYTWPLSAFGNYDYLIDEEAETARTSDDLSNPFTGYNNLVFGAYDLKKKDGLIYRDELFMAKNFKFNGEFLDSSVYSIGTYPLFGTSLDVFRPGDRIAVGENPAAVPLMTHLTSSSNRSKPRPPASYDNRSIHLNGISVEVIDEMEDGSMRIRIRWDNRSIYSDQRWCGDIHLHEELQLAKGIYLMVDLGFTPQKPLDPIDFEGRNIFSYPSIFTLETGSKLVMGKRSRIVIDNLSTLVLIPGSKVEMGPRSKLIIRDSGTLRALEGSHITGRGKIILENGAATDIDNAAQIEVSIKDNR
ncbi:hypothetical protein ACFLTU_00770 [Bacteroidota bacterium]